MNELGNELLEAGGKLEDASRETKFHKQVLRELKHKILPPFLSKQRDKNERFIAFFVINFLEDVSYNLVGEFPYEKETHKIKQDFFKKIGEALVVIGKAVSEKDVAGLYQSFVFLAVSYLDVIDGLNDLIESLDRQ